VDKRTVKFFRATGKGWQTRMNLVLVAYAEARASGAVKGAERFRLDKSAEKHEVDGPPPGWGHTKAEEEALEAQFAEICNRPTPGLEEVPDTTEPVPERLPEAATAPEAATGIAPEAPPQPAPGMAGTAPDAPAEPAEAPPCSPLDAGEPEAATEAATLPAIPPGAAPSERPPRKLTPQEHARAQYLERAAAARARSAAILAERPGETPLERQERLIPTAPVRDSRGVPFGWPL
jgi:hypothetical protein